jgi:hypothetical protein
MTTSLPANGSRSRDVKVIFSAPYGAEKGENELQIVPRTPGVRVSGKIKETFLLNVGLADMYMG